MGRVLPPRKSQAQLKCSFCGKSSEQAERLIAGPGVYICDHCVEICNEILRKHREQQSGEQ